MKTNSKTVFIVIGIIVLIAIGIAIYFLTRPPKQMNHFTFPKTISVVNGTDYAKIDTVAMVLMNKILKYDTCEIYIFNMSYVLKRSDDYTLQAYLQSYRYEPNKFTLFINTDVVSRSDINMVLCHEFMHVRQYITGDLQINYDKPTLVTYKGKVIDLTKIVYEGRQYEIEAKAQQWDIAKQLRALLYQKPN
jgi:hypothetical protein